MELRIQCADGFNLPQGCYVGVRVGEILKQGRYEPQRCFNFPRIERRRNAKIDIYQHVGSCSVPVDPETKSMHEVGVNNSAAYDKAPAVRLNINVQTQQQPAVAVEQREQRTKALKNQARDYLAKHGVEARLSKALKALVKEQPNDPTEFLCRFLRGGESGATQQAAATGQPSVEAIRNQMRDVLLQASENGILTKAVAEVRQNSAPGGAQKNMPPEQMNEDVSLGNLKQRAWAALLEASGDGVLDDALEELKAARPDDRAFARSSRDVESVRQLAREALVNGARGTGLSEAILTAQTGPRDKLGAVRTKARDVLQQATQDGQLTQALQEVRGAKSQVPRDIEVVRNLARDALMTSAQNGGLEKALRQEPRDVEKVRGLARDALMTGARDGGLQEALQKEPRDVEKIRGLARDALMTGTEGGGLQSAMQKEPRDVEAVRRLARAALMTGAKDGGMQRAIQQARGMLVDKKEDPRIAAVRQQAREVLVQGTLDGGLQVALQRTLMGKVAKPPRDLEEVRRLAGEALAKGVGGSLDKALFEVQYWPGEAVKPAPRDVESVRTLAGETLLNGILDGALAYQLAVGQQKVPVGTKSPRDLHIVRLFARHALLKGGVDGGLIAALESVQASPGNQ